MPSLCTVIQTSDRRKAHPCGLPCVEGHDTCQFHIPGVMVPCPIDPNHTVRADRVAAHVKKCPSKDKSAVGHAYFTLDINKGSDSEVFVPEKGIDEGISPSLMAQLPSLMENTSPDGWMHASTVTEAEDGTSNDYAPVFAVRKKQKHDVQLSAMLQQIEGAGLLDPSFTYLEVGCGRGALSVAIQMRLPEATCILVDTRVAGYQRGTVALAKKHGCVGALHRLQIDLKDFNIAGALEELSLASNEKGGRLVIIGKHVCGAGTDFALRMLEQSLPSNWSFAGVAIAQCCH
jgi:tRNA:m4X modification enzyme